DHRHRDPRRAVLPRLSPEAPRGGVSPAAPHPRRRHRRGAGAVGVPVRPVPRPVRPQPHAHGDVLPRSRVRLAALGHRIDRRRRPGSRGVQLVHRRLPPYVLPVIAFFDMDRTVLRINSGTAWVRFLRRRGEISRLRMVRALGWALQYRLSILDMEALSEKLVADLAGDAETDMVAKCAVWYRDEIRHTIAR